MKKSFAKRIKTTRNGKFVRRSMSVNHFRTRKSTNNVRHKRKTRGINYPAKKVLGYAAT